MVLLNTAAVILTVLALSPLIYTHLLFVTNNIINDYDYPKVSKLQEWSVVLVYVCGVEDCPSQSAHS